MKEVKTIVPFPPYDYRIYVLFTDNLLESAEKLVKQNILVSSHGIDETTEAFAVKPRNRACGYIVLRHDAKPMHIAHESYHALAAMFNWIGAKHEEEMFAYHLGYLVGLIHVDQQKVAKKFEKELDKSE